MSAATKYISFGSRKIDFSLSYDNRKSLGIRVHPDGSVKVIAPNEAKEVEVLKKVHSKARWILNQQNYFKSFHPLTPPRRFINGESHLYLGRQYKLHATKSDNSSIKLSRGLLTVYTLDSNPDEIEKQLNRWYKEKAKVLFNELLQASILKFKSYGITTPELIVRLMSKRWGSCTKANKIILNLQLIKAPKACIEYVIVHELCHLIHYDHGKKFHALQDKMMPEDKKYKER